MTWNNFWSVVAHIIIAGFVVCMLLFGAGFLRYYLEKHGVKKTLRWVAIYLIYIVIVASPVVLIDTFAPSLWISHGYARWIQMSQNATNLYAIVIGTGVVYAMIASGLSNWARVRRQRRTLNNQLPLPEVLKQHPELSAAVDVMQGFLKREGRRSFVQNLVLNFLFYVLGVATTIVLGALQSHT